MKMHLAVATLAVVGIAAVSHADIVVGGTLIQDLDSAAFRATSSTDGAYLAGFGVTVDPNQPLLIFGNHFGPTQTAGKNAGQFRPLPVNAALPQITAVPLPRENYRDDPAAVEASITSFGSTSALAFGVNAPGTVPSGLPARNEQASTFAFNPANLSGTATGTIGLNGATSFWYANTPVINTSSVWLGYGDLALKYDAARAVGGDSGWYLENNLLFPSPVYDVQNVSFSNVVAATETTPGSFTMTGDLFTAQEFRDGFGIKANLDVGSFTLNAITAVPEPASLAITGAVGAAVLRRRRRA